jgi:hypothetical protein
MKQVTFPVDYCQVIIRHFCMNKQEAEKQKKSILIVSSSAFLGLKNFLAQIIQ